MQLITYRLKYYPEHFFFEDLTMHILSPGNIKCFLITRHEYTNGGVQVQLYTFFNLGATCGGWSTPRSGLFTLAKETRYPFHRRLDGPQGRSEHMWERENLLPTPVFEPRTVQPLTSRYTGYAIPSPHFLFIRYLISQPHTTEKICVCMPL